MSAYFPDVVKLVICPSVELKHYVYLYLTHYCDYNESCRENALLSVNTFQQDMAGKNPVRESFSVLRVAYPCAGPPCHDLDSRA